jgi:hypothetical protein
VDRRDRSIEHVGLPTACAVIYWKVSRAIPDARDMDLMHTILNDVARALACIVPIYAARAKSVMPVALAPRDVLEGRFVRGAHVFVTRLGEELRNLSVRRRDIAAAISILKSERIQFRKQD